MSFIAFLSFYRLTVTQTVIAIFSGQRKNIVFGWVYVAQSILSKYNVLCGFTLKKF